MMYCSRCGTNNRDGSKFCNNCGAALASPSGVTCPMCGIANQVESAFCANCGARLVPLSTALDGEDTSATAPIKGLSLPAKPPAPPDAELASEAPGQEPPAEKMESKSDREPPDSQEIPDWLAQLRAAPPAEPAPAESTAPDLESMPDWIHRLQSLEPEVAPAEAPSAEETAPAEDLQPAAPSEPETASSELPVWLQQASQQAPETEEAGAAATETTAAAEEAMPAAGTEWLFDVTPEATHEAQEAPSPAEPTLESKEPSFSQLLEPGPEETTAEAAPAAEPAAEPQVADESIPDWLQELRFEAAETGETTVTPGGTAPAEQEKAETAEIAKPVELPEAPGTTAPAEAETIEAPVAEETAADELLEAPSWLTTPLDKTPVKDTGVPDWVRLASASEPAALAAQEAESTAQEGEPAPVEPAEKAEPAQTGELPDWVSVFKPAEAVPVSPLDVAGEPVETSGALAGLRGLLPLAAAIAEPHVTAAKPAPSADHREAARLFDAILAEPTGEAEPVPAKAAARTWTMRPVIYLLLALAVIVPFLLPASLAGSLLRISNTPTAGFYDVIQALPANSTILLAFDYDPSVSGEMDLLASAVVRDLIRRRIKIIALSTLETGPQIAQGVLDSAAKGKDYQYGSEYLNLGYWPGHEAGLAQLAATGLPPDKRDYVGRQALGLYPVAAGVKNLKEVALIVVLAGAEDPLKDWLEQVQAPTGVRVAAAVSAGLEPKALAYRRPGQLVAVSSGLVGAAQYEVLSNQPGRALTSVNAQSAAQLVLIFVIVLGNIVYWASRVRGQAT